METSARERPKRAKLTRTGVRHRVRDGLLVFDEARHLTIQSQMAPGIALNHATKWVDA